MNNERYIEMLAEFVCIFGVQIIARCDLSDSERELLSDKVAEIITEMN